jgi:4-amino-4-deoxy-L-arabinose transferase-like glycosyltransferase
MQANDAMRPPRSHLLLVVLLSLAEALTHFGVMSGDHPQYFNVTRFLLGQEPLYDYARPRVVRLLVPLLAAPLSTVMDLPHAYGVVNTIFYVMAGLVCYFLTLKVTSSSRAALYSSALLVTSFPLIAYGATASKEGAGVFFQLLAALLALRLVEEGGLRRALLCGLVVGVGLLSMEVVLPAIAFGFLLLASRRMFREAFAWLVSLIPSLVVGLAFNYSLLSWYVEGGLRYAQGVGVLSLEGWFNPWLRCKHLVEGLSPLACAAVALWLMRGRGRRKLFALMFLPGLASFLAWPPTTARQAITMFYAAYWPAGLGLMKASKGRVGVEAALLALNAIFNNFLAYRWYVSCPYVETLGPWRGLSIP